MSKGGREREREGGERERRGRLREEGRGRGLGLGRGGELWVFRSFLDFIDAWMGGCGVNKDCFLILLELCTVYFAFQYAAVFDPVAGFQARCLLVVTDGRMVVDGGW